MTKTQLTVEESLNFAQQQAYWNGFAAGVRATTEHAKMLQVQSITASKSVAPVAAPPASEPASPVPNNPEV